MPKKLGIAAGVFLFVSACAETQQAVDGVARDAAKSTVSKALTTRFPAVPAAAVTPFTDCVIDNASAREIGLLARDAVVGVSDSTVQLITDVIARPDTTKCIATAGRAALAG